MPAKIFAIVFILIVFLFPTSSASAQEVLLSPPNPDNSKIQKASTGAPFNPGWNYFTVGFDNCTTLTVLNELQANGGSALNVNAVFVKDFFNWQSYTFQSPKQKKLGANDLLVFNSNQKFFLQIDQKSCTNPDSSRQAQINKVREGEIAKSNLLDKVSELPVDLWAKLTNILNRDSAAPENTTANKKQNLDSLTIGGKTTVNDLGITGKITSGLLAINGLDCSDCSIAGNFASINTISSDLYIQNLGIGGVNILNGKFTIDKNGNVKLLKLNIDDSDNSSASIGGGKILSGTASVDISTTAVTSKSRIFVTLETSNDLPLAVANRVSGKSFTVELSKPASKDLKFSWWIVN